MLSKIRTISDQTKPVESASDPVAKTQFSSLMSIAKDAIANVNSAQQSADSVENAYIAGDKDVSISQVMMASVKSKVAFEGLTAVRNKMIDFYKEIMNMPI
jgi:flagellar hook-basal body complex protein FliE